jgi:hypothetical protein
MISRHAICAALLAMTPVIGRAEDVLDRVEDALTFSGFDDQLRFRFSGLVSLEYYHHDEASTNLIFSEADNFLNPRLSLFFDAQLGPQVYLFAQSRLDRGFDPADHDAEMRLDEWAVRWTPWDDGRLSVQAGQFSTIVGNYIERHLAWDNPFITPPLIYDQITAIYDAEAPGSASVFAEGITDEKYDYNPVVWGPAYTSGLSVSGQLGKFDYAAEFKNASLSSRPESWSVTNVGFDHPTISARLGYRPDLAWKFGVSASEGAYFTDAVGSDLPSGTGINDYRQKVLAQDVSFAWRHWQFWAELYEARFEVPYIGNADTLGYYLEAKYKFTPQLFGALRWNQMFFGDIPNGRGGKQPWGHDTWQLDSAVTYRLTPHMQMKLQYSLQHQAEVAKAYTHLLAAQFTVRF